MNPGGVLLMIAGVWVLSQVWGGDALGRLKVPLIADKATTTPPSSKSGSSSSSTSTSAPATVTARPTINGQVF